MGERLERQRGKVGPKLVVDEVDFVCIPRVARRFLARLEFFARAESDVANQETAVFFQQRQKSAKKADFCASVKWWSEYVATMASYWRLRSAGMSPLEKSP